MWWGYTRESLLRRFLQDELSTSQLEQGCWWEGSRGVGGRVEKRAIHRLGS